MAASTAIFNPGDKYRLWLKNIQDPQRAIKQIGVIMEAESAEAFRNQKHGKTSWKPRGEINIYGIIADFAKGARNPPARRFETTPVLIDTGHLRQSIKANPVGKFAVKIGSNVEYAPVHQLGGDIESEKITETVQSALSNWLKRKSDANLTEKLGWLLSKRMTDKTLTGTVPARPFIGITKQTIDDVREILGISILVKT